MGGLGLMAALYAVPDGASERREESWQQTLTQAEAVLLKISACPEISLSARLAFEKCSKLAGRLSDEVAS